MPSDTLPTPLIGLARGRLSPKKTITLPIARFRHFYVGRNGIPMIEGAKIRGGAPARKRQFTAA